MGITTTGCVVDRMIENEPTDVALMLRVRRGDTAAFEQIHARYQKRMLGFFWSLSHNTHAANDLCQETFLRIWKIRKRYRATGSFPGYLFGIARMVWLERCRSLARDARLGTCCSTDALGEVAASDAWCPEDRVAREELQQHIHRAIDALPEEQRLVFVMRNIDGLSLSDIAEALDCPVNTVRSRKILAMKKLRHLLAEVFAATTGTPS